MIVLMRFLHMLACLVLAMPASGGQGLGSLSPDGSTTERVELDEIRNRSLGVFARRVEHLLESGAPGLTSAELGSRIRFQERSDALADRMTAELLALELDGVLDRSEAASKLGELAGDAWVEVEQAVAAVRAGREVPPWRPDFETDRDYGWRLAEYTLTHRNDLSDWGVVAAILTGGVLLAWFAAFLLRIGRDRMRNGERAIIGDLIAALRGPVYVTVILTAVAVALRTLWIPAAAERPVWVLTKVAFAGAVLWLVWRLVDLTAQGVGWVLSKTYEQPHKQTTALIRKSLQLLTLALVVIISAEILLGVNLESWLLGLGLLGLAFTLAAQDTLKNFFGSLTLVVDKPYRVGDLIDFKGFFGTVEDIGFRSTKVREFDGHLVTIPNSEVVSEVVQNVEARPWIRRRFRIGIRYDTPVEKVREAIQILEEILKDRDDEPDDMKTHIVFEGFGESTLNILVQYCVTPGDYWPALEKGTDFNLRIMERFRDAGIDFAFPTRTAVLESVERPEVVTVAVEPRSGADDA